MSAFFRISLLCTVLLASLHVALPLPAEAEAQQYDLVYTWDTDLDSVLDYKEQLEELLSPEIRKRLKIVKKKNEYGVIYDCNTSVTDIVKVIVKQGEILKEAGFDQAYAIQDKGYHELFNVSYGYGPNLDALIKNYAQIYNYLGKSVGKDLYIEQDDKGNYMLVYRRHGDRSSTLTVAKRHGRLLRKKGIHTSITEELNNAVVFGESTFLHGEEETATVLTATASQQKDADLPEVTPPETISPAVPKQPVESNPVVLHPGDIKVAVSQGKSSQGSRVAQIPAPKLTESRAGITRSSNAAIEMKIESYIKNLRQKGQLRGDEKTGWMVYDLNRNVSLVDINADQSFQAASMIKPFVALAFFHKVKNGSLQYGPKSRRQMEAMIQRSSNSATNWIMRQVGGPATCQSLLTQNYGHLFKKLHIVEYIPAGGRTYRNKALPSDYVRFLRALWNKELPYGEEIRRLMSLPGRDRLYYGTPIPQGTLVYNKTGTTAHLCGDMGILAPKTKNGHRYPYAIVGIIERSSRPSNYKQWMRSRGGVIREVSTLVYKDLKSQHLLK
ncbi:serine hydrolase [Desulfogranum japonicum]|uniref:serine hydrolase n=1 Tax=Desulfogranum japonicum TaxID=231447 RepID=UPI00040F5F46|nr:serine hydrolase [Desulfogranum japonicum]